MNISNPRRILAVSLEESAQHLSQVLKDLTGSHPDPASGPDELSSLAGTTHPLPLRTDYYTTEVPIWLDLVASPPPPPATAAAAAAPVTELAVPSASPAAEWAATFLSPEAREVLDVLGGVMLVFALPASSSPPLSPASSVAARGSPGTASREMTKDLITQVGRVVRDGLGGWSWDGVSLAVGVTVGGSAGGGIDDAERDEWDDICADAGLEFVHIDTRSGGAGGRSREDTVRNEFGEKTGIARVMEAFEANDWAAADTLGLEEEGAGDGDEEADDDKDGHELDPTKLDFGFDRADFEGLRRAIWSGGLDSEGAPDTAVMAGGEHKTGGSGNGNGDGPQNPENAIKDYAGDHSKGGEDQREEGEEEEGIGEDDVHKIEAMMHRLQAVRDLGAGLPEEQRRRLAQRAVGEVMRELSE